jgi:hypothetical protein
MLDQTSQKYHAVVVPGAAQDIGRAVASMAATPPLTIRGFRHE